jgi:hypothetical protein
MKATIVEISLDDSRVPLPEGANVLRELRKTVGRRLGLSRLYASRRSPSAEVAIRSRTAAMPLALVAE